MSSIRLTCFALSLVLLLSCRFLINDRDGAKEDFEESIAILPSLVQSRVKLASVHMELSQSSLSDLIHCRVPICRSHSR